jgi:hypothetical protein
MAIGSEAPIGERFSTWGAMSSAERSEWFEYMRTEWSPNLMAGYATLVDRVSNCG